MQFDGKSHGDLISILRMDNNLKHFMFKFEILGIDDLDHTLYFSNSLTERRSLLGNCLDAKSEGYLDRDSIKNSLSGMPLSFERIIGTSYVVLKTYAVDGITILGKIKYSINKSQLNLEKRIATLIKKDFNSDYWVNSGNSRSNFFHCGKVLVLKNTDFTCQERARFIKESTNNYKFVDLYYIPNFYSNDVLGRADRQYVIKLGSAIDNIMDDYVYNYFFEDIDIDDNLSGRSNLEDSDNVYDRVSIRRTL